MSAKKVNEWVIYEQTVDRKHMINWSFCVNSAITSYIHIEISNIRGKSMNFVPHKISN